MQVSRPKYITFDPGNFPSRDQFDLVEHKSDGWFSATVIEGGFWRMYSRTSRLIGEGPIDPKISRTVLYGEYIFGTEWAKDQEDLYNRVVVFGADTIHNRELSSVTHEVGRRLIHDFLFTYASEEFIKRCSLVEQFSIDDAPSLWERFVVRGGYEGLVFKNSKAPWGADFGRMKKSVSMDYICLGFEESDSDTYAGCGVACVIGGLYVDGKLEKVCKVSGLTNERRKEFFDHPEKYIGKVFEAYGKKITKKGALRHPDFIRWREDKKPEECVWTNP